MSDVNGARGTFLMKKGHGTRPRLALLHDHHH